MQALAWDASLVEVELMKAGRTLMALHVPGTRPAQERSSMPEYVREFEEGYGWDGEPVRAGPPSAAQIKRMDQVLAWVRLIPADRTVLRRIVGLRMLCRPTVSDREIEYMVDRGQAMVSYRRIAAKLGASDRAIMNWHAQGIATIADRLNKAGLCAASGGRFGPSRREVGLQIRRAMVREALRTRRRVCEFT